MKLLVLLIIILCLYLIYRLSFPKQAGNGQGNEPERREPPDGYEPVVKNRFILPCQSNLKQLEDRKEDSDKQDEKAIIFAVGNEKPDAVIPPDKLNEVFGNEPDPDDLDIEPDESELDVEEESEDLQPSGRDTDLAGGFSIEELENVVKAVDNPTDENAGLLYKVEPTDMFERMVSGDEGKAARIRAVIDRNIQSLNPAVENESENIGDSDYKNFNMADYLS